MNWMTENEGPVWMPTLVAAEAQYAIPQYLLARVAYQESRFRADIIDSTVCSKAGCVGLLQLNPEYFPNAGISPDNDIETAAQLLVALYARFKDWQIVLAAYNWGGGNVHHAATINAHQYLLREMPTETQNYVREILADVPVPGVLVPC
jgi:soluble lytic murein transglycosylase-like protein